ncbi:MAG: hypothetical protein L0H53_09340 [Candidatus Nitrosocosmicus sp.]|nr:hypothetical protein [Candidatus Nitrosocosmicus sp.]MDN5868630.1 hypothetical protein [Candidatus Nitrosocosmicus sp.]
MGFEDDQFQLLLREHDTKNNVQVKAKIKNLICNYLEKGDYQSINELYSDKDTQDHIRVILAQIVCDRNYDHEFRKKSYSSLKQLRAVNFPVLKKWISHRSPDLLTR